MTRFSNTAEEKRSRVSSTDIGCLWYFSVPRDTLYLCWQEKQRISPREFITKE